MCIQAPTAQLERVLAMVAEQGQLARFECRYSSMRLLCVDPGVKAAGRLRKDTRVAQCVGKQRTSLVSGEQVDGKSARLGAAPQLLELRFGPVDDQQHQIGRCEVRSVEPLVEFGAETAQRATVTGDDLALSGEFQH